MFDLLAYSHLAAIQNRYNEQDHVNLTLTVTLAMTNQMFNLSLE